MRLLATYSKEKFLTGSKLMLYETGSGELENTSIQNRGELLSMSSTVLLLYVQFVCPIPV